MAPINGQSADPKVAAVKGEQTGSGGFGVWGVCATGHGVHGDSTSSRGVVGTSQKFHGVFGKSVENVGVAGESDGMQGVLGVSHHPRDAGVLGTNDQGGDGVVGRGRRGVVGESEEFQGVFGKSTGNAGVVGESQNFHAVFAISHSPNNGGVFGANDRGGFGVIGRSDSNTGVSGESDTGVGVHGKGGHRAGLFEGDLEVTGDFHQRTGHIRLGTGDIHLGNGDCAEDFDVSGADKVEAGTVMVLGEDGTLSESQRAYDNRVAGVISGAGDYSPGIVLDKRESPGNRQPVALMGKVYCKVDARFGAIEVGDLLTTSPTPGHAMKTTDPFKAFGAVIGKALRPLSEGRSVIPILVALQ
jgi:hypothetical protein